MLPKRNLPGDPISFLFWKRCSGTMSLVFGLAETDLVRMIQREQVDVTAQVAALNEVRQSIQVIQTTGVSVGGLTRAQGVIGNLRAAADRLDESIRSGNEKIRLWSDLQRRLRGGPSEL